jgi:hypothetical protein
MTARLTRRSARTFLHSWNHFLNGGTSVSHLTPIMRSAIRWNNFLKKCGVSVINTSMVVDFSDQCKTGFHANVASTHYALEGAHCRKYHSLHSHHWSTSQKLCGSIPLLLRLLQVQTRADPVLAFGQQSGCMEASCCLSGSPQ